MMARATAPLTAAMYADISRQGGQMGMGVRTHELAASIRTKEHEHEHEHEPEL